MKRIQAVGTVGVIVINDSPLKKVPLNEATNTLYLGSIRKKREGQPQYDFPISIKNILETRNYFSPQRHR